MRPYLAVVYDSFLEAFKSRILWVLLFGWTALLAALAPFSWIEGTDFQFRNESITNRESLTRDLNLAAEGKGRRSQQRVWAGLDENFQEQVRRAKEEGKPLRWGTLAEGLSGVLDNEDLYDSEAWPDASKRSELSKELEDYRPGSLKGEELARVNQRLVELAFPTGLKSSAGNAIWIGYAGMKLFEPIPVSRAQLRSFIDGFILINFLKLALGVVGIFIAVIVTSNLVPDMFAPGSMALLLSKPINRSGLLLSKYFGGLCFILINVTYLIVGFYFILGWRMEIWNTGLLWCIPLFLFVFMIFYSVSTLAGLVWKNAVVSIVCVGLFWGACFILELTHGPLRLFTVDAPQITRLNKFGDHFFGSNRNGELLIWSDSENRWKSIGGMRGDEQRVVGPLWLPDQDVVVFGRAGFHAFFGIQNDGAKVQSLDLRTDNQSNDPALEEFVKSPLWSEKRLESLPGLPSGTKRLKVVDHRIVAVGEAGAFKYDWSAVKTKDEDRTLFGVFKLPALSVSSAPQKLTEEEVTFQAPIDFCSVPGSNDLLVLSKSKLQQFQWSKGDEGTEKLALVRSLDLALPEEALALVAANGSSCMVCTNKKKNLVVDLAAWSVRDSLDSALDSLEAKEVYPVEKDHFLLLTKEGDLHLVRQQGAAVTRIAFTEPIKSLAVEEQGQVFACTIGNVIQKVDLESGAATTVCRPTWTTGQWVYWTIVRPIYAVSPKPSAVDNLMQWALQSDDPLNFANQTEDMEESAAKLDLWTPIWSNSLFIVVMLSFSCWYLRRQDN